MTNPVVVDEVPGHRAVPTWMIPGWVEEFGVIAGVTGRGSEPGGFDLGLASEQPTKVVIDRWRRLGAAFGEFNGVVVGRQIHGTTVRWHQQVHGWTVMESVDGHATSTTGLLLTVSLADCIPVYLVDPVRRVVGLLHSGWRGTAAGMVAAGIESMQRHGAAEVGDLVVHCGVGICGACYEVGPDVAGACGRPPADGGPSRLDLRSVIAESALRQGVGRVTVSSQCSAHMRDRYFSHRGSGGSDGRMVAFLGLPGLE